MSPTPASFELERFSVTPVTDDTVLFEIGGVLTDVPPRSAPPRLLVEGTRRARREHSALESEVDGERLRASFVVPAADVETGGFALAVGGLLLELPAADPTPGSDRAVALARELNGARRELTRMRARIEADAEVAGGHAGELAGVREEAGAREQEALAAAEARAVGAETRATELEVAASQLETVLADVQASAEQRDATAAAERRGLEAELGAARSEVETLREEAAEATRRERESGSALQELRSELELARRALDGRDAELSRSPDRRARAIARPRTVAGVIGEHAPVEPERDAEPSSPVGFEELTAAEPSPDAVANVEEVAPDEEATVVAPSAEDDPLAGTVELDAVPAQAAPRPPDVAAEDGESVQVADYGEFVQDDDDDDGDPVPDDGEAESTTAHEAMPARRPDLDPPEDTGPIPLRRSSQRRYVPRSDRDEELGSEAVRVIGEERPRASALPPAPDADPGLPAGITPRTAVIGVLAIAAFLVLVAILGYVF